MTERILELLESKRFSPLRAELLEINPVDIALMFDEVSPEQRIVMFRLLPKELAAETFVELDGDMQESLIKSFSDKELKAVVDELYLDDAVDIIEEMPAGVVKRILHGADPETRKAINELLKYPKDSAGSLMTPEFVDLKRSMTIEQAFNHIKKTGVDKETVYTCYVTDSNRKLKGIVTVKDLLFAEANTTLSEIMETNVISAGTLDDKEDVAQLFDKYDLSVLPVVDKENRLVGIITVDDAIDVIQEENTEDIEKMAAIISTDKPYLKTGIFETVKNRIPWLLILMLSATFTGAIISGFEAKLKAIVVLTSFIPMLMGTGGNSGSQSSVTIIRGLSLGEIEIADILRVIWKELRVGVLCGIALGVINYVKILLVDYLVIGAFEGYTFEQSCLIAFVVCVTMAITIVVAKLVGCALPIIAEVLHLDPAVMASPFITTIVDAISLLIYFGVTTLFLTPLM